MCILDGYNIYNKIKTIFDLYSLTIWCMKIFVNVRNWVTIRATLPGMADKGMIKLIWETMTIAIDGK